MFAIQIPTVLTYLLPSIILTVLSGYVSINTLRFGARNKKLSRGEILFFGVDTCAPLASHHWSQSFQTSMAMYY